VHARDKAAGIEPEAVDELEFTRRQLEESEARFRDIIERNADAIVVVDQAGIVRFANQAATRLFNQPAETLLGSSFGFPVAAGETTELDLAHNGEALVVEMRVVESQWRGAIACIASLRDVTERKRSEERQRELIREQTARSAAEEEARRFRFLAESSSLLSSSLNDQAIVSQLARLSVAEISEYAVVYCLDKDNALQRTAFAVHGADEGAAAPKEAPEVLRIADDIAHNRPREVSGLWQAAVSLLARGKKIGVLVLLSTWRELSEAEVALADNLASRAALAIDNARLYAHAREANQTKTELLAVISHDLRTPLNSIIGYGQLLELGIPDTLTDASRERVHRMLQSSNHLLYLIDELLAFARLEGNYEDVHPAPVDAADVVREVAELMEPLASEKGLVLRAALQPGDYTVTTDKDKLRQVLVNLVGNAVKYTAAGTVELSVERVDGTMDFRVTDTGVGIAADDLPHIFQPFWQVDRSQRTHGGGTGLGLSVVQNVVRLLGGRIKVESKLGDGTTFTLTLPS
jgi:signal transduction histidine kinase